VDGAPLGQLVDEYVAQCAVSTEIVAAASLDDVGRNTDFEPASLRWILQHMLEETARHVGHLDLLREQLDGARGYW
jgi:hypothetical protein